MKAIGYFSLDRKTVELLASEAPSVSKLFQTIVSQAFTYRIAIRQIQGGVALYKEGSRPWGQYELARAANLSINTVRRGLWRLSRLKLIDYAASKLGTIVQVLNFFRYRRQATGVDMTRRGDQRVSKIDNYRGDPKRIERSTHDPVVVQPPIQESFLGREGAKLARELRLQIFGW